MNINLSNENNGHVADHSETPVQALAAVVLKISSLNTSHIMQHADNATLSSTGALSPHSNQNRLLYQTLVYSFAIPLIFLTTIGILQKNKHFIESFSHKF
jgi:hypothetical protein